MIRIVAVRAVLQVAVLGQVLLGLLEHLVDLLLVLAVGILVDEIVIGVLRIEIPLALQRSDAVARIESGR